MERTAEKERIIYVDILRIMSIVSVIILHITADILTRTNNFDTASWWVSNVFNSVTRFAVPVFFMISGAMILRLNMKSYKDFYLKRVWPLVISLVSWSLLYGLYYQYYIVRSPMTVYEFLRSFAYKLISDGNYVHLWFLYAIIAIYITVPMMLKLVKACSEKDLRYFLTLWFIVSVVYRFVSEFVMKTTSQSIYISFFDIPLFTGFLGYFILGYYLYTYELTPKLKSILFNLGVISFFATPVATYFASRHQGILDEMFYGNYSITVFFMAIAIFIYFQEKEAALSKKINVKIKKMIGSLSKASFSIYLIHLMVQLMVGRQAETEGTWLETVMNLGFNVSAVFIMSYVVVKILNLNKLVTKLLFGGRG